MAKVDSAAREPADFSIVLGGPFYRLLLRSRLLRPRMALLHRRIIACILITWLPLAVLAVLGGDFLSGVRIPFLYDLDTHVRFLIGLPLLIAAEVIVDRRLREVVEQFRERELIAPPDRQRFETVVSGAMRLSNAGIIELLLLLVAIVGGFWLWRAYTGLHVTTWYAAEAPEAMALTPAGYWYAFVSLPISRFLLLRWYYRLFVWYLVLFQVSCLHLRLNPLHPDRAGGLEFLSLSADAFAPILIVQTGYLAGFIGKQIWYEGAVLPDFKFQIAGFVGFLMLIVLLPLGFFVVQMAVAKRKALLGYGLLSAQYAGEFRQKWLLQDPQTRSADLLGSADIQSLSDLANSYAVVREMRLLPFGRGLVVRLAILIALPLLPLALALLPFEVMVERLIKVLL